MADLSTFSLPESPLNIVADALINHLSGLTDMSGAHLFARVERGLIAAVERPPSEIIPLCCVWHENEIFRNDTVQFYPNIGISEIALYLYYYSFSRDSSGAAVDLQLLRNRLTRYVLRSLCEPESGSEYGLKPDKRFWYFPVQDVAVDHVHVIKGLDEMELPVVPPWYVDRIRLSVVTHLDFPKSYFTDTDSPS